MSARVRTLDVQGFDAIALENEALCAVIIPSLGGRVWELTDKRRDRQWIWHRPTVPLARPPDRPIYDDVWAGGWEELFPNDAPTVFEGRALPDHGEWWSREWDVDEASGGDESVLRMSVTTAARRTSCAKVFRLDADANEIRASYRITSLEAEPFHFLFKQHLPIALTPSCRLATAGGIVTPVDPMFGTLLSTSEPVAWPGSGELDLRRVPPRSSAEREFVYVTNLTDGWCGVDDLEQEARLRMNWSVETLPYLWLFLTFGGWRGCYTAVLEPCTNLPKDLAQAARLSQSARLQPGQTFEASVAVRLSGLDGPEP